VRGNPWDAQRPADGAAIPPARAGEPQVPLIDQFTNRAYPRACGGTRAAAIFARDDMGLSPRVRGNPKPLAGIAGNQGPIPARAGEPQTSCHARPMTWAYPRACGGTGFSCAAAAGAAGLSPRVRGNPVFGQFGDRHPGPIPARAGEPPTGSDRRCATWAYPRACGGTQLWGAWRRWARGLSPRVRGNPKNSSLTRCGLGLSPRVRGNLNSGNGAPGIQGPIPARAGEPESDR